VSSATVTALSGLQALTGLTQLRVEQLSDLSPETSPLLLPALQHLELDGWGEGLPMSFLSKCTQLRVLSLSFVLLSGTAVASTMLQHLELRGCSIHAAYGAATPITWQQIISGAGQLPHLTSLVLRSANPDLEQADIKCVVACCSRLQVLHLDTLQDSFASALAHLSSLTSLQLGTANDHQCSSLAQLTGLRELTVQNPKALSGVGLWELAALEQLTSLGFFGHFDPSKLSPVLQEQMSDRLLGYSHAIISKVRVRVFLAGWEGAILLPVTGYRLKPHWATV